MRLSFSLGARARNAQFNPYNESEPGWTIDPPLNTAAGAIDVYIGTGGSDANTGLSHAQRKATMNGATGARSLLSSGRGDRVWFQRGGTYAEGLSDVPQNAWNISGQDQANPTIIGAYFDAGSGGALTDARPKIVCPGTGLNFGQGPHDIWIKDLEVYPSASYPTNTNDRRYGVDASNGSAGPYRILVEGCYIHGFRFNVNFTGPFGLSLGDPVRTHDITIRRSCIADAWAKNYAAPNIVPLVYSSGLYAWACDNLLLEQSVFDHNGWLAGEAESIDTQHNHGVYMAGRNDGPLAPSLNAIARNSMFSSGSNNGCMFRGGGQILSNLFSQNASAISLGKLPDGPEINWNHLPFATGVIANNVVTEGRDLSTAGLDSFGITAEYCANFTADHNIVCNSVVAGGRAYQSSRNAAGTWSYNVGNNWTAALETGMQHNNPDNVTETNNDFWGTLGYQLPLRTVELYAQGPANLGGGATYAEMLTAMRTLRRGAWNPLYLPESIRAWIAQGGYSYP